MPNALQTIQDFINNPLGELTPLEFSPDHLNEAQLLSIGNVVLHGFEAPDLLHVLREQRTCVKEHIGGGRTVQTFGSQPGDVSWQGKLVPRPQYYNRQTGAYYLALKGGDTIARMKMLENICHLGEPVDFIFGFLKWIVIVSKFDYDIISRHEIDYSITLVVVEDVTISPQNEEIGGEDEILRKLNYIISNTRNLIQLLRDSEIYAILAAEFIAAIDTADKALIGLAGLITANAIAPQLGLISVANELVRIALLVKTLLEVVEESL